MAPGIGIGIGIHNKKGGINWSSYWTNLNLKAVTVSSTEIDLTWNGNVLVTVQRSTDGVNYTDIGTSNNGYSDTGLTANTLYYYRLKGGVSYSGFDIATTDAVHTLIQDFDTFTDFAQENPANIDVCELSTDRVIDGTASLKLKTNASGAGYVVFALTPNIHCDGNAVVRLFRNDDFAGSGISLLFSTVSPPTYAAGTWVSTGNMAGYEGKRDQATFKTGWNNTLFKRTNWNGGTLTLLDDPEILFKSVRIGFPAANTGPVLFDSIRIGGPNKANFLITFDDGSDDLMEVNAAVFGEGKSAFDYMVDNDIKATIYIISSRIGTASYLSVAQLATVYAAGWDLGNHTNSHLQITTLTDAQITTELETCRLFLDGLGFTRASRHVAYPGGSFTLDTHPALLNSLGYRTGRQLQRLLNAQVKQDVKDSLFNLFSHDVGSGITAANITDFIDLAIAAGKMGSMYIHGLGTPESASVWDPAKLKTVIDYIVTKRTAGDLDCLTISEWYKNRT